MVRDRPRRGDVCPAGMGARPVTARRIAAFVVGVAAGLAAAALVVLLVVLQDLRQR